MSTDKRFKNMAGKQFGRLTVLEYAGRRREPCGAISHFWKCLCACGKITIVAKSHLTTCTQSCGCLNLEISTKRLTKHGMIPGKIPTPEYRAWSCIKTRCTNKASTHYAEYGGRGIGICQGWSDSPAAFREDTGPRPTPKHQIDRIDNNGGYWCGHCPQCVSNGWPSNCKWSTKKEQMRNRRSNVNLTVGGVTKLALEWAKETGVSVENIYNRLEMGWSDEDAVITPVKHWSALRRRKNGCAQ